MTVKELRTLLEKLPDDLPVEVWDEDGEFEVGETYNVFLAVDGAVVLYDNNEEHFARFEDYVAGNSDYDEEEDYFNNDSGISRILF
jgi:flavorubredoxin